MTATTPTASRVRPTTAELSALDDLTTLRDAARSLRARAVARDMPATASQCRHLALQLDAAATCLVQEGDDYLDAALAVMDAAADRLAAHAVWIGKNTDRDPEHRRSGRSR